MNLLPVCFLRISTCTDSWRAFFDGIIIFLLSTLGLLLHYHEDTHLIVSFCPVHPD